MVVEEVGVVVVVREVAVDSAEDKIPENCSISREDRRISG